MHNRDEYCHAFVSEEFAKIVFTRLNQSERRHFVGMLIAALEAFVANDYSVWHAIVDALRIEGGHTMIDECRADPSRKRLLRDYSGLYTLCGELDVLETLEFDWGKSQTVSVLTKPPSAHVHE